MKTLFDCTLEELKEEVKKREIPKVREIEDEDLIPLKNECVKYIELYYKNKDNYSGIDPANEEECTRRIRDAAICYFFKEGIEKTLRKWSIKGGSDEKTNM
jgi:hypothetical protein